MIVKIPPSNILNRLFLELSTLKRTENPRLSLSQTRFSYEIKAKRYFDDFLINNFEKSFLQSKEKRPFIKNYFTKGLSTKEDNVKVTDSWFDAIYSLQKGSVFSCEKRRNTKVSIEFVNCKFTDIHTDSSKCGVFCVYVFKSRLVSCYFINCTSKFYYHVSETISKEENSLISSSIAKCPFNISKRGGISLSLLFGKPSIEHTNYSVINVFEFSSGFDLGPSKRNRGIISYSMTSNISSSCDSPIWIFQTDTDDEKNIDIHHIKVYSSKGRGLIRVSGGLFLIRINNSIFENNQFETEFEYLGPKTKGTISLTNCFVDHKIKSMNISF